MNNVRTLELPPTVVIDGKRYMLSDHPGFMIGDAPVSGAPMGARLIECSGNRHRYLWAFDAGRKQVRMWRVSDGDEKSGGDPRHFASDIVKLERSRQLNRLTSSEFDALDEAMRERVRETLASLRASIRRNETDWDRRAREIARAVYTETIAPTVERQWAEVDAGIVPIGFKLRDYGPRSPLTQRRMFVLLRALDKFTMDLVYAGVRARGFDPDRPPGNGNSQAVEWARCEVIEELYESVLTMS